MSRTPFQTGDLIEYRGVFAKVIKDFGLATLVVKSTLSDTQEIWQYEFEEYKCNLVRSINDLNNVILTQNISPIDGTIEINIDLNNFLQNAYGPKCRIILNGDTEHPLWDNTI